MSIGADGVRHKGYEESYPLFMYHSCRDTIYCVPQKDEQEIARLLFFRGNVNHLFPVFVSISVWEIIPPALKFHFSILPHRIAVHLFTLCFAKKIVDV
jgi:hypothetical protein